MRDLGRLKAGRGALLVAEPLWLVGDPFVAPLEEDQAS